MADIGADLESAQEMVQQAEDELLQKHPEHELVAYLKIEDRKAREVAWQKQLRKFSKDPNAEGNVKGAMECTYALAKYLIALEVALGKRQLKPEKSKEERMADPHDSMWDLP